MGEAANACGLDSTFVILVSAALAALSVLLVQWLWARFRKHVFRKLADRETGEQRRRSAPVSMELSLTENYPEGSYEAMAVAGTGLVNERGFFTTRCGLTIFYQSWFPAAGAEVDAAVVCVHGYGDHCDFGIAMLAKTLCNVECTDGRIGAIAFDLPGHGRSDGLAWCIKDWFEYVDVVREVLVDHIKPIVSRWRAPKGPKIFGLGESMGGGVLFSILAREKDLLDGVIFVCPMLFVAQEMLPPRIVVFLFKYVFNYLFPLWPVAPASDMSPKLYSDQSMLLYHTPKIGKLPSRMSNDSRHVLIKCVSAPRLCTANSLAFVAGEWMRARLGDFDTPCLILHGQADEVTDPRVSEQLFSQSKCDDKRLFTRQGSRHCDLLRGGPAQADAVREHFQMIRTWLLDRSCGGGVRGSPGADLEAAATRALVDDHNWHPCAVPAGVNAA